jgi:hypothetical protein
MPQNPSLSPTQQPCKLRPLTTLIKLLGFLIILLPHLAANSQPVTGSGGFSDVVSLMPESGELFVITHADRVWDKRGHSKRGIQNAIRRLKERMTILLLSETPDPKMHFLYRDINFLLPSESGEIHFSTSATRLFLAGGFLGACLDRTKYYLLKDRDPDVREINLTFITDGIFGGRQFLWFFERDLKDLLRERLDQNSKTKLETLADFFSFIDSQPDAPRIKKAFIESWLDEYESGHPDLYEIQHESRVEVRVNGEPALIREPAAPTDRILRIDFSPSDSL